MAIKFLVLLAIPLFLLDLLLEMRDEEYVLRRPRSCIVSGLLPAWL